MFTPKNCQWYDSGFCGRSLAAIVLGQLLCLRYVISLKLTLNESNYTLYRCLYLCYFIRFCGVLNHRNVYTTSLSSTCLHGNIITMYRCLYLTQCVFAYFYSFLWCIKPSKCLHNVITSTCLHNYYQHVY